MNHMKNINKIFGVLLIAVVTMVGCSEEELTTVPKHVRFTDASGAIGEADAEPFKVSVHLAAPIQSEEVTIGYEITGGTAVDGTDYTIDGGNSITIPGGELFASFNVITIDNFESDGNKTVEFTITSVSGDATIGLGLLGKTFTLSINDDDCSPNLAGTYSVSTVGCGGAGGGTCGGDFEIADYEVTVTRVAAGVYELSDLTGGLYAGPYGAADNPGQMEDECGVLTFTEQPDVVYGGDVFDGLGSVNEDGSFVVEWSNGYGDSGVSTFVKN